MGNSSPENHKINGVNGEIWDKVERGFSEPLDAEQFEQIRQAQPEPRPAITDPDVGLKWFNVWSEVGKAVNKAKVAKEFRDCFLRSRTKAIRVLRGDIPKNDFLVYDYIQSRTLEWNKPIEIITTEHFLRGVPEDNKGRKWGGRSYISNKRSLFQSIQNLRNIQLCDTFICWTAYSRNRNNRRKGYSSQAFLPFSMPLYTLGLNFDQWEVDENREKWLYRAFSPQNPKLNNTLPVFMRYCGLSIKDTYNTFSSKQYARPGQCCLPE